MRQRSTQAAGPKQQNMIAKIIKSLRYKKTLSPTELMDEYKITFFEACWYMDYLESVEVVGPPNGGHPRNVYPSKVIEILTYYE